MRKKIFYELAIKSFILLLVGLFLGIIADHFVHSAHQFYFYIVPIAGYVINLFAFFVASGKMAKLNFSTLISSLFIIKFFSYVILALLFLVPEKNSTVRLWFIAFLFINYIFFTTILLILILKYLKSMNPTN
jgi:hypothetical protein